MPDPEDKIAHLGYEIYEGSDKTSYQVIGFTQTKEFTDETEYDANYTPTYMAKGIDRNLHSSGEGVKIKYKPTKIILSFLDDVLVK